eukprot:scaffold50352_cov40-Cyclotella_meneghiniana.AAC.4
MCRASDTRLIQKVQTSLNPIESEVSNGDRAAFGDAELDCRDLVIDVSLEGGKLSRGRRCRRHRRAGLCRQGLYRRKQPVQILALRNLGRLEGR